MINFSLYKLGLKSNFKIFFIFLAILTMYISVIISMYNPENAGILANFTEVMPELMSLFGMNSIPNSLISFLVIYLYGFLFLVIPLISTIIISNKLVASHTDKGSIAYLLASPNKRKNIIFTQTCVLLTFTFLTIIFCTIFPIIISSIMFPNELPIKDFLVLNIGLLFLHIALSGICFLGSCIANDSKTSLTIGAGIPLVFFLIQMLNNIGDKFYILKYLSIFSLFNPNELLSYNLSAIIMIFILLLIGIILYFISYKIFNKKDFSV